MEYQCDGNPNYSPKDCGGLTTRGGNHEEMDLVKQPETRDRFIISAEVEPGRVGDLLAQLTKMGFEKIGHELITDVADYKRNGAVKGDKKDKKGKSVKQFVAEYIEEHPSFAINDLCLAFAAAGYSPNNAYKIAKDMVAAGSLRKLNQNNYQRADIRAIAPPAKIKVPEAPAKSGKGPPRPTIDLSRRYDVSNRDLMLQAVGKRKTVTTTDLRAHLAANGRPEKSASPMIFKMTGEGLFEATKVPGTYRVTEKGQQEGRRVSDRLRNKKPAEEGAEENHG